MPAVLVDVAGGVATVTLNEPDRRNPMSTAIMTAFEEAIDKLRSDADVRAVVVTGAGPAFCAGADLRDPNSSPLRRGGDLYETRAAMRTYYGRFQCLADVEVPTIAAVNGAAVGGGLGLALCADIRIFAEDAKLALNFAKLGIHPGMATTYTLPAAVGRSAAAELFFTGRFFDGREAERLGLGRAIPREDVLPAAQAIAAEIAGNPPSVIRMLKRALAMPGERLDKLEYEMSAQILLTNSRRREGDAAGH
jgi:enoyl-CoA hydratase/carnithine racemase